MVGVAQARTVLTNLGWLSQQPQAFQAEVLRNCMLMRFAPGDVIYRLGDPLGGVYGLVAGAVTVSVAPPVELGRLLHVGLPGSWIGEGCFLVREPRRVGMQAAVETWMMHLPLQAMDRIASHDPLAQRYFTKILMMNLDILVRAFYDLQNPDEDRRIALALLRVVSTPGNPVPLSQAELATMSRCSRRVVNVALQRFEAAHWITKGYRSIVVRNVEALRRYAQGEQ